MYSSLRGQQQPAKPLPGYTGYRPQYEDEAAHFGIPSTHNQPEGRIPGKISHQINVDCIN